MGLVPLLHGMERMDDSARDYHERIDPHPQGLPFAQLLLGGQDGLVNVLGVILGVAAASEQARLVLAAGLAAAIAESVSMAAVAWTSTRAERHRYLGELAREHRHLDRVPELERDEIRAIYRARGFGGELLDRIVAFVTADRARWIETMMLEEHRLIAPAPRAELRASLVVGLASLFGSLVPLAPFLIWRVPVAIAVALPLGAACLFAAGAWHARATVGKPLRAGLELAGIGITAAMIGWAIGRLFHV